MRGAQLNAPATTGASFRNARLADSPWVLVAGSGTDFRGADLHGANFTSASLATSKMTGADLTGANLMLADMTGVDLAHANLDHVNFCQTTMPDGTVRNPQPSAAAAIEKCGRSQPSAAAALVIDDTNPYVAIALTYDKRFIRAGATMQGCRLVPRTPCRKIDLTGRDLTGAIIPYARLQDARLAGADLTAGVLDLAQADGAHLCGVILVGGSTAVHHFGAEPQVRM